MQKAKVKSCNVITPSYFCILHFDFNNSLLPEGIEPIILRMKAGYPGR